MKKFFYSTIILISVLFSSCSSEISLKLMDDNTIEFSMNSNIGKETLNLLKSFSEDSETVVFDTYELKTGLESLFFEKVQVSMPSNSKLHINFHDSGKSILKHLDILSVSSAKICFSLTPDKFLAFYNESDDAIKSFLDLLIAPVLNEETMTSEEYFDILSSFYGEEVAGEIKNCTLKIILEDDTYSFKLIDILSGNKSISIN